MKKSIWLIVGKDGEVSCFDEEKEQAEARLAYYRTDDPCDIWKDSLIVEATYEVPE